jgi:hypothetical protein
MKALALGKITRDLLHDIVPKKETAYQTREYSTPVYEK